VSLRLRLFATHPSFCPPLFSPTAFFALKAAQRFLVASPIDGLVARAAKIAEHFDRLVAAQSEAAVLYDLPRTSQACGVGLGG
jgi:hypothetical protein